MTSRRYKGGKGLAGVSIGVKDMVDGGVVRNTNAQIREKKMFACGPQHVDSVYRTDWWRDGEWANALYVDDAGRVYLRKTHATRREQWYRVPAMDTNEAVTR
jgi:hypothetical protein